MPHTASAKKRLRQNAKRQASNRSARSRLTTLVRRFTESLAAGDLAKAEQALRTAQKAADQTGAKRIIHKNTAGRTISRMARKLQAAKAAKKA